MRSRRVLVDISLYYQVPTQLGLYKSKFLFEVAPESSYRDESNSVASTSDCPVMRLALG